MVRLQFIQLNVVVDFTVSWFWIKIYTWGPAIMVDSGIIFFSLSCQILPAYSRLQLIPFMFIPEDYCFWDVT